MKRPARVLLAASALFACAGASVAAGEQAPVPDPPAARTRITVELRASPLADQFFDVRARAEPRSESEATSGDDPALAAAAALRRELGSPLAWGPVEGLLAGADDAKTFLARVRELPESFEARPGATVALRDGAVRLAEALLAGEPGFREKVWPEHEREIAAARERLAKSFVERADACYARLARELGFEGVELAIPVELVFRAPFPGAVTQRDARGRGVCFVAVEGVAGTQLDETVLHETIHALDVAKKQTVLEDLRARLRAAGFGPRDRELRDVPHTLMFVEAAAVIRREVDPAHQDYGDVARYYAKIPSAALVKDAWSAHLEGKQSREETLAQIVAGVVAARGQK